MSSCKIEVKANKLNQQLGYSHLFIVLTDTHGNEYAYRGGPSANPDSPLVALASPGSYQNSEGPFGYIRTDHGNYDPSFIDYNPEADSITIAEGNDICNIKERLIDQLECVDSRLYVIEQSRDVNKSEEIGVSLFKSH